MKVNLRQLRQIIKEAITTVSDAEFDKATMGDMNDYGPGGADKDRPWGTYAEKDEGKYWDTIMMSPNGDSFLVDGRETHLEDVPDQITGTSGIEMSDTDADNLIHALETQQQDGHVELGIEYTNGKWSW
jgi:hypothetical protein